MKPTSQKLKELPVRVANQRALDEIISEVVELESLRMKTQHVVQSVNTIRGVMSINHEHKDLFGGAVYLVDYSHMWALVRNTEDLLDALLAGESDETE